jgi:molybdopterin molybdotransferase
MAMSYDDALHIIRQIALEAMRVRGDQSELVSPEDAVGRIAAREHCSTVTTPAFDTSAMDGYAICSSATATATPSMPIMFCVKGTIAAGDEPLSLLGEADDGIHSCVEIMTGARFPQGLDVTAFDACVKIEDTSRDVCFASSQRFVKVSRPVAKNANRRFAGEDFRKGEVIFAEGEVIRSRHIMALAAVGIDSVAVRRRLRIAIWSTGKELVAHKSASRNIPQTKDTNGPFLLASLREMGIEAKFVGVLEDDEQAIQEEIGDRLDQDQYDLIITTGAVSKGKFDFMLPALKALQAPVRFHGVAIRPGHPVLFATVPSKKGNIPFFGLPGNPVATAACFRFLVVPLLRCLMGDRPESPLMARCEMRNGMREMITSLPSHFDCFRHGRLRVSSSGDWTVELSQDQSPSKISHFSRSNCWLHFPAAQNQKETLFRCFPYNNERYDSD